jgi:hypothetical protein
LLGKFRALLPPFSGKLNAHALHALPASPGLAGSTTATS